VLPLRLEFRRIRVRPDRAGLLLNEKLSRRFQTRLFLGVMILVNDPSGLLMYEAPGSVLVVIIGDSSINVDFSALNLASWLVSRVSTMAGAISRLNFEGDCDQPFVRRPLKDECLAAVMHQIRFDAKTPSVDR
jgi:hypothetical protein